jgi:hypothetical protein
MELWRGTALFIPKLFASSTPQNVMFRSHQSRIEKIQAATTMIASEGTHRFHPKKKMPQVL